MENLKINLKRENYVVVHLSFDARFNFQLHMDKSYQLQINTKKEKLQFHIKKKKSILDGNKGQNNLPLHLY